SCLLPGARPCGCGGGLSTPVRPTIEVLWHFLLCFFAVFRESADSGWSVGQRSRFPADCALVSQPNPPVNCWLHFLFLRCCLTSQDATKCECVRWRTRHAAAQRRAAPTRPQLPRLRRLQQRPLVRPLFLFAVFV